MAHRYDGVSNGYEPYGPGDKKGSIPQRIPSASENARVDHTDRVWMSSEQNATPVDSRVTDRKRGQSSEPHDDHPHKVQQSEPESLWDDIDMLFDIRYSRPPGINQREPTSQHSQLTATQSERTAPSPGNVEAKTNGNHNRGEHGRMDSVTCTDSRKEEKPDHGLGETFDAIIRSSQQHNQEVTKAQACTRVRQNEESDAELFNTNADMRVPDALRQARQNEQLQTASTMRAHERYRALISSLDQKLNEHLEDKLDHRVQTIGQAIAQYALQRFVQLAAQTKTEELGMWEAFGQQRRDLQDANIKIQTLEAQLDSQADYRINDFKNIRDLQDRLSAQAEQTQNHNSKAEALEALVKSQTEQVTALSTKLEEQARLNHKVTSARLSTIETEITGSKQSSADLSTLSKVVEGLASELATNKSAMNKVELSINESSGVYDSRIIAIAADVENLKKTRDVADFHGKLRSLENDVSIVRESVKNTCGATWKEVETLGETIKTILNQQKDKDIQRHLNNTEIAREIKSLATKTEQTDTLRDDLHSLRVYLIAKEAEIARNNHSVLIDTNSRLAQQESVIQTITEKQKAMEESNAEKFRLSEERLPTIERRLEATRADLKSMSPDLALLVEWYKNLLLQQVKQRKKPASMSGLPRQRLAEAVVAYPQTATSEHEQRQQLRSPLSCVGQEQDLTSPLANPAQAQHAGEIIPYHGQAPGPNQSNGHRTWTPQDLRSPLVKPAQAHQAGGIVTHHGHALASGQTIGQGILFANPSSMQSPSLGQSCGQLMPASYSYTYTSLDLQTSDQDSVVERRQYFG